MKAVALLVILAIGAALGGCSFWGTMPLDRVALFERDLNLDRDYLYENFDPGITDYTAIQTPLYTWNVWFPESGGSEVYTLTKLARSNNTVSALISGPAFSEPTDIRLRVVKQSFLEWRLGDIYLDGTKIVD